MIVRHIFPSLLYWVLEIYIKELKYLQATKVELFQAYELSTLTGTQVMLLVASETGHVYTFATRFQLFPK